MSESIIIKSKIKDFAVHEGKALNVASEVADELNERVIAMIKDACKRAKSNQRNTLMARDV